MAARMSLGLIMTIADFDWRPRAALFRREGWQRVQPDLGSVGGYYGSRSALQGDEPARVDLLVEVGLADAERMTKASYGVGLNVGHG
jgi:hypothetical protein